MTGMRRGFRTVSIALTAGLVAVAGLAPSASPEIPALPTITKAEVLEIARVPAPPPGIGLRIHADFPDGSELVLGGVPLHSLTADITPTGDVQVIEAHAAASSTGSGGLGSCKDRTFLLTGVKWRAQDLPVRWKFRASSTPDYISTTGTRWAVKKAHRAWPRTHTRCDNPDEVNFRFKYSGTTGKLVGYDGTNMVDFGVLGSKALAVNYTWYKDGRILEVDMRLNRWDYKWKPHVSKTKTRFIVGNVATHEIGHQLGLADLSDPHGSLTMFARIKPGETTKTKLGRGDMKGASFVSP